MKLNSNFYLQKGNFIQENDNIKYVYDKYLLSKGKYKTKIRPEDLPEYYVKINIRSDNGFVNAKGVVAMIYKPNLWINHLLRDDRLYISYNNKIEENTTSSFDEYTGYDEIIYGYDIIKFLKAANIYSDYNLDEIKNQLEEKRKIFKEKHPKDYTIENPQDIPLIDLI